MAARLLVVHSNLGALPETSGGLTHIYPFIDDPRAHAELFAQNLAAAIAMCIEKRDDVMEWTSMAAQRVDRLYAWERVAPQWADVLGSLHDGLGQEK
jgi:glycosyltransferase involved in cell wall biosynthesis